MICPLFHIDNSVISSSENRRLTVYKSFYNAKNNKFNLNFGNNFEDFLKDRFHFRIELISLIKYVKYFLCARFVKFDQAFLDKNNYMMYDTLKITTRTPLDYTPILKDLSIFNKYCEERNIKLYVAIHPSKDMIYVPVYFRDEVSFTDRILKLNEFVDKLNKNNINTIFPYKDFIKAKKDIEYTLFFYTDPHGTADSAFIMYNALMSEIQKDFHLNKVAKKNDFDYFLYNKVRYELHSDYAFGHTCSKIAGLPYKICEKLHDKQYRYYVHKDVKNMNFIDESERAQKQVHIYPFGADLKVLIFGDSFVGNIQYILPYNFKHTTVIRPNNNDNNFKLIKYYNKEIQELSPDIIIIYIRYGPTLYKLRGINDLE